MTLLGLVTRLVIYVVLTFALIVLFENGVDGYFAALWTHATGLVGAISGGGMTWGGGMDGDRGDFAIASGILNQQSTIYGR